MTIHVLHVPMRIVSQRSLGERWCFECRRRAEFTLTICTPVDPMSYYGPGGSIECEKGHHDGDCFPGTFREWTDA